MSEAMALSNSLAVFVATYLLHSTVLLSACWVALKLARANSHFLIERMWKSAAVLGLLTAALQVGLGTWLATGGDPKPGGETVQADEPTAAQPQHAALGVGTDSDLLRDSRFDFAATGAPADSELVNEHTAPPIGFSEGNDPHSQRESGAKAAPSWQPLSQAGRAPGHSRDNALDAAFDQDASTSSNSVQARNPIWWTTWQTSLPWVTAATSLALASCVVAGGLLLVFQSVRLRSRFASARILKDGPARRTLDRFLKRNRIKRRVRLLASSRHAEPVTYGLVTWTIVLPENTEQRLAGDELKALLSHEVAHLVRGDVWWLWVGRVLCTCLAFQPLNWLARKKWQQASEYLCDDWAVQRGVRPISLARCLTQIAEWRFGQQACELGLAAGGTKATLVQRVERLVKDDSRADVWTKPVRRKLLTLGAAVVVVGFAGFAPRVALPLAIVSDIADVNETDETATRDWHALEEELLQLEADLQHVTELLRQQTDNSHKHGATNFSRETAEILSENLNRRAASLRARRQYIASLLGKDSKR